MKIEMMRVDNQTHEGSITSFDKFSKMFINHFAASKIYVRDSDYLSIIKQRHHESLKDYMTHFTTATMEIPELNPEVQLHAIKSGLRPGKFQEAIVVAKPKTLEEFRDKATEQIEIEELRETQRNERPPSQKEDNRPTKFNTRREDIKEILHNRLIKPPIKAETYQDQKYVDKSKHYAFHQKFGHTTDECVVAKDLHERLARQGLLDKYISTRSRKEATKDINKSRYDSDHKEKGTWCGPIETPTSKVVINYISSGFAAGGGLTNS
ncbi:uncharacterized protein [Arachis hypogaea]|uniref:uncharacterized protein n=1 Tax=Arachis hypogaea TaxID=3818 RepID=UPI003B219478